MPRYPTYVLDHFDEAEEALLSVYKDADKLRALIHAMCHGAQLVEDDAFDLLSSTPLDVAAGSELDRWGALVSEGRGGLTDDDYRRVIYAKIAATRSAPIVQDVLAVVRLITGTSESEVTYREAFPAFVEFTISHDDDTLVEATHERIERIVNLARAAGVAYDLVEARPGVGFIFDSSTRGFDNGLLARRIF